MPVNSYMPSADFDDLQGMTMKSVVQNDDTLIFTSHGGGVFHMGHRQDCCESVWIEGDLSDLCDSPILFAYEESGGVPRKGDDSDDFYSGEERTWTFYRISTNKGTVVIRWMGSSNGYYSTDVGFYQEEPYNVEDQYS